VSCSQTARSSRPRAGKRRSQSLQGKRDGAVLWKRSIRLEKELYESCPAAAAERVDEELAMRFGESQAGASRARSKGDGQGAQANFLHRCELSGSCTEKSFPSASTCNLPRSRRRPRRCPLQALRWSTSASVFRGVRGSRYNNTVFGSECANSRPLPTPLRRQRPREGIAEPSARTSSPGGGEIPVHPPRKQVRLYSSLTPLVSLDVVGGGKGEGVGYWCS
jgi:hypothetical protein